MYSTNIVILFAIVLTGLSPISAQHLRDDDLFKTLRALEMAQNAAVNARFKCTLHAPGLDTLASDHLLIRNESSLITRAF